MLDYGAQARNVFVAPTLTQAAMPVIRACLSAEPDGLRSEESQLPGFKPALAYWNQRHKIAASRDRILALSEAVGHPYDLWPYQFAQLMAAVLDFRPEVVLELGRGYGNSTCAFAEAAHQSGGGIRVVSVCNSEEWSTVTVPRLRQVVSKEWFKSVQAIRGDILQFDYGKALSGVRSAMLFWDAHGFEVAECVLGGILPLFAPVDHVVLMHDLSDNRYLSREQMEYGPNGIWKGNNWSGPRLQLGVIDTAVEQAVASLDFATRNHLTLDSADHSYHTDLSPDQKDEMEASLGNLFDTQGHWFYFTLNEHPGPYTFPHFVKPSLQPAQTERNRQ